MDKGTILDSYFSLGEDKVLGSLQQLDEPLSISINSDPINAIYNGLNFPIDKSSFPLIMDFLHIPSTKEYAWNVFQDLATYPIKGTKEQIINNLKNFHYISLSKISLPLEFINITEYIYYLLHNEFRPTKLPNATDLIIREQLRQSSHTSLLLTIPYIFPSCNIQEPIIFKFYELEEVPKNLIAQIYEALTDKYHLIPSIIYKWMEEIDLIHDNPEKFEFWLKSHGVLPFYYKMDTYFFHNLFESNLYINSTSIILNSEEELSDSELYKLIFDNYQKCIYPRSRLLKMANELYYNKELFIQDNIVYYGNRLFSYKTWHLYDVIQYMINSTLCVTPDNDKLPLETGFWILEHTPDSMPDKQEFENFLWSLQLSNIKYISL